LSAPIVDHPGFPHIERLLSGGAPSLAAADLLTSLGVSNLERAARSLQSLALHPSFPREDTKFLVQFFEALGETFEPERALDNLERILESRENPDALLSALRRSAERRAAVLTLAGGSQFLSDTVLRHPEFLDWLLRPSTLSGERKREKMFSELRRWVREAEDEPGGPGGALRRFRQREYLRIGIRDLMRTATMRETTLSLSHLADAALEAALQIAQKELRAQYGKPRWRRSDGRLRPCEFAVIGMGKLGGQELNFSSDIDLLFVYSSDDGGTSGVRDKYTGRMQGKITNHEYHVRLARRLIQLMAENTAEGHVFRVDTRLRPEGSQGALAYSLRSCEVYYESWGETWERQALIKARLCAGSEALGLKFDEMIRPFIYRRTLDLSALDEISRIKDRINSKLAASGRDALNVKLGEGGIREIEFIIQSYQLIYGGKESLLRTPNSLQALSAIGEAGLLPFGDTESLAEAYIFMRDVEHRVQVTHGLQTHDLPSDPHGLTVLARKMGFRAGDHAGERDAFENELKKHQEVVARIFGNLFRRQEDDPGGPALDSAEHPERAPASAETLEDSLSPADLAPYNFADPASASTHLRLLRNGEPFKHISARAKRMFDELLPRLLYLTLEIPDPNRAVANLYRFVEKAGGREAVFSLMVESEKMFELLLRLFGSSDYLSEILSFHPGLFDTIVQAGTLTHSKTREEFFGEMESAVRRSSSAAGRFAALADAKRGEVFVIGMRSLLGEAGILESLADLTHLADAAVATALSIAKEETRSLYGEIEADGAGFAIIGMGKLGGSEMNFGSDLDLVFVYSGPEGMTSGGPAARGSASRGPLPIHEYFLKLATTLRDGLVAPGVGGHTYEIDLRLRPEGQKGSLVSPLGQIARYFGERAESWERQALCRARFIAGSEETGKEFMALARQFVFESPLPENFAGEVDHMRRRLEREIARETQGNIDIKLGRGGIADIDFIVQYLQITEGRKRAALRRPDTYGAIGLFLGEGLLTGEEAEELSGAYRFLRLLESRLRIAGGQSLHTLPKSAEGMEILARRAGYEDDDEGSGRAKLLAEYESRTRGVRRIYEKVVGGVDSGP
jgi:glutamate-ammonia-ligase adenylyltransferase